MTHYSVHAMNPSSVLYLYSIRDEIQIDPEYQRAGEIWTLEKRQLLIDSILNGFDLPKIYFHEFVTPKSRSGQQSGGPPFWSYAIIDGRQRLETVWSFIDGEFALSDKCAYLRDKTVQLGMLTYSELGAKHPKMKALFDGTSLPVIAVQTDDLNIIEDLFSRLNEAVPLNAPERRNAFQGPLPQIIRSVARHRFFGTNVRVRNNRYQHLDIATKLLLLASSSKVVDLKKVYLDAFVRDGKGKRLGVYDAAIAAVKETLDRMAGIFVKKDLLLSSSSAVILYFLLVRAGEVPSDLRKRLIDFDKSVKTNQELAEKDIAKAEYDLLEYGRLGQTPNDSYSIEFRLKVLRSRVLAAASLGERLERAGKG